MLEIHVAHAIYFAAPVFIVAPFFVGSCSLFISQNAGAPFVLETAIHQRYLPGNAA